MPDLYTHLHPDLDAHLSCWAVRKFVPGMADARIIYVSANWDGSSMKSGDMAVDMHAGGHGIKGTQDENGTVHSSSLCLIRKYASPKDYKAIEDLVLFVDIQDAYGSVVNHLIKSADHEARRMFAKNNIGSNLRALEYRFPDDSETIFSRMCEIFDGHFEMGGDGERRAQLEADQAELFANGKVALVKNKEAKRTDHVLWERGVRAIVYIDGPNLGVLRRGDGMLLKDGSRFRADHPEIQNLVQAKDSSPWFAHPKGFLYCHGSRKAPAVSKSNVNPYDLVKVISKLLKQ